MSCDLKNEVCGAKCTGYDGAKVWEKIHNIPKEIDCETCAAHADELFTGVHDVVNIGLGKKAHNPMNLKKFMTEVNCVYNKCVETGQCL